MVKKILVEGLDYAGKSTLCLKLVDTLNQIGFNVKYNKGNIFKNNFEEYTKKELYVENPDLIRLNALLTLGHLTDSLVVNNFDGIDFLVQESYIDRTIGFNIANKIPFFANLLDSLYDRLVQFDLSLFLDATIEERQKRYVTRFYEKTKYDEMIFQDPKKFLEINSAIKESILRRPNCVLIDNSDLNANETYLLALDLIKGIIRND